MATFTFNGSQSVTTPFNTALDQVIFNLTAEDLVSISEDRSANVVTIVAASGAVLTLTGTNLAAISAGNNFIAGLNSDIDFAIGSRGADNTGTGVGVLTGNVAVGLEGADSIVGSATEAGRPGALLFGNLGNDTISNGDGISVRMYGGQGNDDLILGTDDGGDASLLVGGMGADDIDVGGDTGAGYLGDVTVFGGNEAGDPTDGSDEIDVVLGSGGRATIFGNGGNDEINVTAVSGVSAGFASVYGGQGNDTINADVDGGLFVGGLGADVIDIDTAVTGTASSVTVFGGNGAADAADGNDIITVTLQANDTAVIFGNGGDDLIDLDGGDASVTVFGGQGNDSIGVAGDASNVGDDSLIYGGLGSDEINIDVVSTGGIGSHVTVYGGNGSADAADGSDSITVALDGDARDSAVAAETALVFGNGGDDEIVLTGAGAATVFGGQGNDTISVVDGLYTLTGGQGADTFNFSGGSGVLGVNGTDATFDTDTAAADIARITDLNLNEDKIDVGADVTAVFNLSATATSGATLAAAAVSAVNSALTGSNIVDAGVDIGVLFTYQNQTYLVQADSQDRDNTATASTLDADDIDAIVNVTGFTGTFDANDFVTL